MAEITLKEMVQEIKRENALRRSCYPQWKVKASVKRAQQYDRQLEISEAIERYLEDKSKLEQDSDNFLRSL